MDFVVLLLERTDGVADGENEERIAEDEGRVGDAVVAVDGACDTSP